MFKIIVRLLIVAGSLFAGIRALAQTPEFQMAADSMVMLMEAAGTSGDVAEKEKLATQFQALLVENLKKEGSFDFRFDSIPHVNMLTSNDGLVRIFTWGVPTAKNGVFNYFCIIQHRVAKQNKFADVFVLEDTKSRVMLPEQEVLKYPNWYGCLYYQMVEKSDGKTTYYTLIGYDFNGRISSKKYIEALTFDKNSNPVFGAPIFMMGKTPQKRVVFEYTSQSVMLVRYYSDMDKIVFNYLYPIVETMKNDKRYYVPDVTYEGLMFKLGKWIKVPNVEMKRKN